MKASMCFLTWSTEVNDAPFSDWPCRIENQHSPRGACRRKVECHERVTLEPFVVLLVCIQIVEDDLQTGLWIVRDDFIHEVEKFLAAAAFLVGGPDPVSYT